MLAVLLTLAVSARFDSSHRQSALRTAAHPLKTMPTPGDGVHEELDALEKYWDQRLTYPTGDFNPAWVRQADAQDAKIPRAVPAGSKQAFSRLRSAAAPRSPPTRSPRSARRPSA